MPEVLRDSPSLQEILWNFSRFRDEKYRLALRENPHFYEELPTSPEAYGNSVEIYPTEDFRRADNFYVLTDKPEPVHIVTDQVSQSFGDIWCPQNAIIFKGLGILLFFFSLFLMSFQIFVGGSWGKASSGHLSKAHTVGSVSGSRCLPFREPPRIVVYCSRLLQRGARGRVGNVRLAVSRYTALLILAYACAVGKRPPIVRYVASLSHIVLANIDIAPAPVSTNV